MYDNDKPANGPQDIPVLPESVGLYLELLMEAVHALETDQEIVPETLRLDVWKKQVKSATVTSKRVISPIMLPDGSHPQSLQIIETVTLLQSEEDRKQGS